MWSSVYCENLIYWFLTFQSDTYLLWFFIRLKNVCIYLLFNLMFLPLTSSVSITKSRDFEKICENVLLAFQGFQRLLNVPSQNSALTYVQTTRSVSLLSYLTPGNPKILHIWPACISLTPTNFFSIFCKLHLRKWL